MSKFYLFIAILGVLVISQEACGVWFFQPFNFRPIKYTTTSTTTTTTAAPVTDETTTAATTAAPVQISAGFVTGQVFNQTTAGFPFFQQLYPQFGNGGSFQLGGGGGYPTIGGLARPFFSRFPFFGGLARPPGINAGSGPVIGGLASPNGK